jgi:hypothetical protein
MIAIKSKNTASVEKKSIIKNKFFDSSLQFFQKPIKANRVISKLLWLVFLVISVFANLYYVILNIIDYSNYDITTSIYTINEFTSKFPTITLCDDRDLNFNMTPIKLWFNYKELTNEWENHFETYFDSVYGKCYRFNSGKNMTNQSIPIKYSKKSGYNDGLILEIYSEAKIDFSQMHVYIHNHTQTPNTIYNKGSWITSGSENDFVISRVYDQKQEIPYNECFKNVSQSPFNQTIINSLKLKNYDYTQKECIVLCRQLKYMEESNCNCSINSLEDRFRIKCIDQTTNINIKNCSKSYVGEFSVNKCIEYCPLECDSFIYQIQEKSHTILATSGNLSAYFDSSFKSFDEVSRSYYGIYVYFDDLKYTHIKQHPKMEIFGLLSNIGGTFSLFLGLSFFSFLEIFEILVFLVLNLFTLRNK